MLLDLVVRRRRIGAMRKMRLLLMSSLAIAGCGGNGQLRSEVADLQVSMEAMEARQTQLESRQGSTPSTAGLAGVEITEANAELLAEIEQLRETQAELLAQINRRPPPRPRRPRPDTAAVYSVDITGSPFAGAKNAKVTVVQAFEFA